MRRGSKFVTALLTGAMVVSMFGMTVMADEVPVEGVQAEMAESKNSIEISASIDTGEFGYAPVGSITYTIAPAAVDDSRGNYVVAGPAAGLLGDNDGTTATIAFDGSKVEDGSEKNGTVTLRTNVNAFGGPGVYGYTVTAGDFVGSTGVTRTSPAAAYDVLVFVENTDDNGKVVSYVVRENGTTKAEKKDLTFTYKYETYTVTVENSVTGNQGEKGVDFTYNYTITPETLDGVNETEKYLLKKGNVTTVLNDLSGSFALKHGESVTFIGLNNDTIVVTEDAEMPKAHQYTTAVTETTAAEETEMAQLKAGTSTSTTLKEGYVSENKPVSANVAAFFNNYRATTAPTGLVMNYIPYILMAAIAGAFAFVMLRRKNREDEI